MIQPLYPDTMSLLEMMSLFIDAPPRAGYDIVHDFWQARLDPALPNAWDRALNKGVVAALLPQAFPPSTPVTALAPISPPAREDEARNSLQLIIRPDSAVDDGRYANTSWLQELPRPLTKLTWDNVAMLSPKTAQERGLQMAMWSN